MLVRKRKFTPYPPKWMISIFILYWIPQIAYGKLELSSVVNHKFSQNLYSNDGFRPMIPGVSNVPGIRDNDIYSDERKFDVFQGIQSVYEIDRSQHSKKRAGVVYENVPTDDKLSPVDTHQMDAEIVSTTTQRPQAIGQPKKFHKQMNTTKNETTTKRLEDILLKYVRDTLGAQKSYELFSGLSFEFQNGTQYMVENSTSGRAKQYSFDEEVLDQVRKFSQHHVISLNIPRALESGRLFFFTGLKKILWPIFIGIQIAKTILLALFLPSILGSFRKIVGKGLSQVSGFNNPSETVADFDFKDNSYNFDQDMMAYNDYANPQSDTSATSVMQNINQNDNINNNNNNNNNNNFAMQMYDAATTNNALSRFGFGDQKATYINTGNEIHSKNSANNIFNSKVHDFKVFHDIPASSLLLSNYDPFYSPLLSRLDAVFLQLGLKPGDDECPERLVCLMYGNPAKYAPYSNLISAQLSRELNELRRPISDNPDILRFFKYMRAAKDGQEGVNCETMYSDCTSFKDYDNPAMIHTYNDINKLVHARKIQ